MKPCVVHVHGWKRSFNQAPQSRNYALSCTTYTSPLGAPSRTKAFLQSGITPQSNRLSNFFIGVALRFIDTNKNPKESQSFLERA